MPAINLRTTSSLGQAQGSTPIPTDLIAAATICLFLTTSAVCARIFTKVIDLRHVQVDDYAIIFAGAGFAAFVGLLFAGANTGLGVHMWTLSPLALKNALLYSNVLDIIYTPVMLAAKVAILIQIDRLFSGVRKKIIYWGVRVLIVLNALCYSAMFFAHIFACMPRAKISNPSVPGKCVSQTTTILATGTINVVSDVIILLFAVWGVSRLQLSAKRQTLVALVFSIGSFACVASACRLVYGAKVDGNRDFTIAIWPVHMWSLAELTSIIYVACCPTFPRLIQYLQGRTPLRAASVSPSNAKWSSSTATRVGTPLNFEKSPQLEKSPQITQMPRNPAPAAAPSKPIIREPLPTMPPPQPRAILPARSVRGLPLSVYSEHSLGRPASHFAPSERPISHLSYESHTTAAIEEILSGYNPNEMPMSPISPARTDFSVCDVEDAVHMKIMPVYFATIKKTTDVRVSSHTNPGSPIALGKPEPEW